MKLQSSSVVGVTDYYSRVVLMLDDSNIGEILPSIYIHAHLYIPSHTAPISTEKSTAQYSRDANIEPQSAKQKLRVLLQEYGDMFVRI